MSPVVGIYQPFTATSNSTPKKATATRRHKQHPPTRCGIAAQNIVQACVRTFISFTAATFALGSRLFCHHRENSPCVSRPLSWEGSGKPRSETGREGNGVVVRLTSGDRRRRQSRVENATSTKRVHITYVCSCANPARLIHLHAPFRTWREKKKASNRTTNFTEGTRFCWLACMYVYSIYTS